MVSAHVLHFDWSDFPLDEALSLLRHLVLASADHRHLATKLQAKIIDFRKKLDEAIEDSWRDREAVLSGVVESGGMGLGGSVEKAREVVKPVVSDWRGLGALGQ